MEEFNKKVKGQKDLGKKIQALLANTRKVIRQKEKLKIGDPKGQNNSKNIGTKFNETVKNWR